MSLPASIAGSGQSGLKSGSILGYRILDRIGAGGFGEVWRAEAPGGLLKAVKILYGYHDERRARDELKALDRIKDLRHPFLLSLERIEVVDSQLVVITELADRSLADLFDSNSSAGQPGIPREELLEYLRQAADALDFIALEHKLQHLDVKPENLLLVGRHAKLADFGLVKDLRDASQSLMGGLTAQFAAPELFDGRPSMQSDQYSLAIVYQEMLTGKRPFTGTTLAQLAAQHMHAQPDLTALPKHDRLVIGRALSKSPAARFPSCRVMIDELADQRLIARSQRRQRIPTRSGADTAVQTRGTDSRPDPSSTNILQTAELRSRAGSIRFLEPPPGVLGHAVAGPTLLVGVGRTATRILQLYKDRVYRRIGDLRDLPAVRILCLDTDRSALTDATTASGRRPLSAGETVSLPLRRPEDYRSRSNLHKNWLNRRWIYNVPKTQQTEGLRPLGRLAFVDNFEPLCTALQQAVSGITAPEATAQTAERLGREPGHQKANVYLVSAISGGAGSGMTLDLAYAIRLLLEEHGIRTATIHGLMLHATNQKQTDLGISIANTFAFLTELRHCVQNGYPGEEACGLPALEDDAPFDHHYFLHLGDDTPDRQWQQQLESVAEYLYLSTLSPAAPFFEKCRALESNLEHFALRSFGTILAGPGAPECQDVLVELLRNRLLERWVEPRPDRPLQHERMNQFRAAADAGMTLSTAQQAVDQLIPASRCQTVEAELARWVLDPGAGDQQLVHLMDQLNNIVGELPPHGRAPLPELNDDLLDALAAQTQLLNAEAGRAIVELYSQSRLALGQVGSLLEEAIEAVETGRNRLSAEITEMGAVQQQLLGMMRATRLKARKNDVDISTAATLASSLVTNRRDALIRRCACEILAGVARKLGALQSDLRRMKGEMTAAMQSPLRGATDRAVLSRFSGLQRSLAASQLARSQQILDRVEQRVWMELANPNGGYWGLLGDSGNIRRHLVGAADHAIASELNAAGRTVQLDSVVTDSPESGAVSAIHEEIRRTVAAAMPLLGGCGGAARLMVGIPLNSTSSRVPEEAFAASQATGTIVPATDGDLVIATEVEDVPLADVAFRLLEMRTDCVELARRLQSRTDVEWKSLEDLL